MVLGSRAGFGLEFHIERDPGLLCLDIFVGGLHVNSWDNAFYPPLLVKKLGDELRRFRAPAAPPVGFGSPSEAFRVAEAVWTYGDAGTGDAFGAEFADCEILDWGECTNDVLAFAFPDGDRIHLACRVRGQTAPRASAMATVSRTSFVETLEHAFTVAEREWSIRLAAMNARRDTGDGGGTP
ncbi:hypothetical protein ACWD4V_25155 [Streptomyces tsukubensis]